MGTWSVLGLSVASVITLHLIKWPALIYTIFPKTASSQPSQNEYWDSGVLALAGELLRNGNVPYQNYWDHRPPLIHLVNAAALELSHGQLWSLWVSSLISLLLTIALGYYLLQRLFGPLPAAMGIALFTAALPPLLVLNSVEQYALPFQWVALAIFMGRDRFDGTEFRLGLLLGAVTILACLLRNNIVASYLSVALVISIELFTRRRVKAWGRFLAGGLIGLGLMGVLFGLYLATEGSLAAFWDQVVRYNYLMYTAVDWKTRVRAMYSGLLAAGVTAPLLIPLAGWLVAIVKFPSLASREIRFHYLLGILWLPIELTFASLLGRDDSRYFMTLLPPFAFLTALLTRQWLPDQTAVSLTASILARRLTLALSFAVFVLPAAYTAKDVKDQGTSPERVGQIHSIVRYINEHTDSHESVLIWGHAPEVYLFAQRTPAARFLDPSPLLTPRYADGLLIRQFMDDLLASSPSLIVDAASRSQEHTESQEETDSTDDLLPTLAKWDPEWKYPDARKPEFFWWHQRPSLWISPPALHTFYDFVARHYTLAALIGPQKWAVYRRADPSQQARQAGLP